MPALSIAKDLSVQAASAAFEQLFGSSPVGAQAWTLFRTRRGKPFTRAWLRDVIAKADEPAAVQIVSANGATRAAFLHFAGGGDPCLCLVMPAVAAGSLDESFEALLARAPQPMALTSPKGVILAANDAFRALFLGKRRRADGTTELCGKSLALLVADASSQNVRDRIASLGEQGGLRNGAIELQATLKGGDGRSVRLVLFPAANGSNLIVTAIESGAAALGGEDAVQSQKLQAVGELAGGIAHDFNNLLTAIIGHSDLLLRRFRASDSAFKDVMNIKGSATRAAELVEADPGLFAPSNLAAGHPEAHRRHRGIPGHHGPHARREGQGHRAARPRPLVRKGRRGPDFPGDHEPRGERARRDAGRRRDRDHEPRM